MVSVVFTCSTCHSSQMSNGYPYTSIYLTHVTDKTAQVVHPYRFTKKEDEVFYSSN